MPRAHVLLSSIEVDLFIGDVREPDGRVRGIARQLRAGHRVQRESPCGVARHGIEHAIANMRVIDALFRSAKSGAWEKP